MSNFERFILAGLRLVPNVIDAIRRWADADDDQNMTPIDVEVRDIMGPAEDRLVRAIERAKAKGP